MQSQKLRSEAPKVVPKRAQCKFSAQKSFLRECRAKNLTKLQKSFLRERRVSSEATKVVPFVVPKEAQNKFQSYKSRS